MTLIEALNAFQDSLSPTDKLGILRNPYWPVLLESAQQTVSELHRCRAELLGRKAVEVVK